MAPHGLSIDFSDGEFVVILIVLPTFMMPLIGP
jgi:hypothetical protein